jgi:predicted anti-sigma-YlaC factor YlaD
MECLQARILVSARLDGEALVTEQEQLEAHLAGCPACRAFASDATALHRVVRVAPAEPVPDLTAAILAATAPPDAPTSGRTLRLALVIVALLQVLLSLPALFGTAEHTQHLAAFDLALAVGLFWVAARPERTLSGFLPIGTALVVLCLGLTFADAARGDGESARAVTHSLAVLGMIVAWLLEARIHHRPNDVPLAA